MMANPIFSSTQGTKRKQSEFASHPPKRQKKSDVSQISTNSQDNSELNISLSDISTRPDPSKCYRVPRDEEGSLICIYLNCKQPIQDASHPEIFMTHLQEHENNADLMIVSMLKKNESSKEEDKFVKLSARGKQIRIQMDKYGNKRFKKDNEGKYVCFFEGCTMNMWTNFSRHIKAHELRGDKPSNEQYTSSEHSCNNNNNSTTTITHKIPSNNNSIKKNSFEFHSDQYSDKVSNMVFEKAAQSYAHHFHFYQPKVAPTSVVTLPQQKTVIMEHEQVLLKHQQQHLTEQLAANLHFLKRTSLIERENYLTQFDITSQFLPKQTEVLPPLRSFLPINHSSTFTAFSPYQIRRTPYRIAYPL